MEKLIARVAPSYSIFFTEEFRGEILRKSLHILIALVPTLAAMNLPVTMALLAGGTMFYVFAEKARREGYSIKIISDLTLLASRDRDKTQFVLGPVTLGIGAMFCLLFYPHQISAIAIYALAFGDSIASLFGKAFGRIKIPFCKNKTIFGSASCFTVIFFITYFLTGNFTTSYVVALTATFLEALPTNDLDNIIMPIGTGFVASLLLPILQ